MPAGLIGHIARMLCILSAVAFAPFAKAQDVDGAVTLPAASNWILDYADDSCALRRVFGEEGKLVFLEMRQFAPNDSLQIIVSSDDIGFRHRPVEFQFLPDPREPVERPTMAVTLDRWGEGFMINDTLQTASHRSAFNYAYWDPAERAAREESITGIRVARGFAEPIFLKTGSLAKPMQMVRECVDELLTHWGVDAEAQRTLLRAVSPKDLQGSTRRMVRSYPARRFNRGEQAMLRIRMNVDENGQGTSCKAQLDVADEDFEQTACKFLMRDLSFNPALGKDGEPIASFWTTTVLYKLP